MRKSNLRIISTVFNVLDRKAKGIQKIRQRHPFARNFHGAGPPRPSTAYDTSTCDRSPDFTFRASVERQRVGDFQLPQGPEAVRRTAGHFDRLARRTTVPTAAGIVNAHSAASSTSLIPRIVHPPARPPRRPSVPDARPFQCPRSGCCAGPSPRRGGTEKATPRPPAAIRTPSLTLYHLHLSPIYICAIPKLWLRARQLRNPRGPSSP